MKKIFPFILLCVIATFGACDKDATDSSIAVTGVVLDEISIELTPQQSKTLKATITPDTATDKQVVWSSDDETTATVSAEGLVTGRKVGTTKVWVKPAGNASVTAECTVVVSNPDDNIVDVTEITLDKDNLTVEIDQTTTLSVTITPENATNRNVSWNSSDPTIATVSKTGSVTGLAIGTTRITVTSNADSEKSARCEVRVTEKSIPATDIWMKTTKLELRPGESGRLDAVTIPTNATNQTMIWSSDDTSIAEADKTGRVTGITAGVTTVWVMWGPDHAIKDKCTVTVLAESSYAVGDLYPDAKNPIGVVFWKDPNNPMKGKIVSLTETKVTWATKYTKTHALNENDGAENMKTIHAISGWETSYPAFKWCSDIGSDWYLPAISEMQEIYKQKDAIASAIEKISVSDARELQLAEYWTSTEKKDSQTYFAVTIQCYVGQGGGGAPAGGQSFSSKDIGNNTRAVMKF